MENKIHRAMAIIDTETGKLLKYKQLLKYPKYKGKWKNLSANEFGRLVQGVGGRIKEPKTIMFIQMKNLSKERMKDVTYGQFVCMIRPEKTEQN